MNSEVLSARLQAFVEAVNREGLTIVETMAMTGQSLIQDRIQRDGVPGVKYSTHRFPVKWLKGKSLNSAGEQYIRDQEEAGQGARWDEFRIEQGLQASKVDLTYTGRMFGGTRVQRKQQQGSQFIATVAGTDQEVDDKLSHNADRYGPEIFDPTPEEQAEVDEIASDFLEDLIRKIDEGY